MMDQCLMSDLGSDSAEGGALHGMNSNFRLSDSNFTENRAHIGGAINVECPDHDICEYTFTHLRFNNNIAKSQGGAINYKDFRPDFMGTTWYNDNEAPYGVDIASYAIGFEITGMQNKMISDLVSGQLFDGALGIKIVDFDEQVIVTDSMSTV